MPRTFQTRTDEEIRQLRRRARELRRTGDYTLAEIGAELGVASHSQVERWCRGIVVPKTYVTRTEPIARRRPPPRRRPATGRTTPATPVGRQPATAPPPAEAAPPRQPFPPATAPAPPASWPAAFEALRAARQRHAAGAETTLPPTLSRQPARRPSSRAVAAAGTRAPRTAFDGELATVKAALGCGCAARLRLPALATPPQVLPCPNGHGPASVALDP